MDEEDSLFAPSFAEPLRNSDPDSIRVETWVLAEDPVREVLDSVRPSLDSEEKRKDLIEYVQKLIKCNLQLEVFPYGSVPLKTYLPDGDIDLTVLSTPNLDDLLPCEVLRVLQEEEKNGNSEFKLRDTQFIDAEVKLVKCLVEDIVVDISFNQLGGICTLCFLEQVDRLAGRDHLFKQSVILIKSWCYYESRILGAHHGLISTYALETLVLYIFHVFHASLKSPLEVLYRFLDYYAKFDWDNYCISLDGPVCKSALPTLAVETLENQGMNVLLDAEFRKKCRDLFMVPSKEVEPDLRTFNLKYLNIIDPLKENNNLGRSVHKGNYFRITSAFRYGARMLGKILQQSNTDIKDDIKMFFRNTLQRHNPKYALQFVILSISTLREPNYEDDFDSRFSNDDFSEYVNDYNTPRLTESNLDKEPELSDLAGDYDANIRNMLYGQGCHGHALFTTMFWASPSPSLPTLPYGNKNPWDGPGAAARSCPVPFEQNLAPQVNTWGRGRGHGALNDPHLQRSQAGSGEPKLAIKANRASQNPLRWSPKQAHNADQTHQQASQLISTANGYANQSRTLEFGSFRSMHKTRTPQMHMVEKIQGS